MFFRAIFQGFRTPGLHGLSVGVQEDAKYPIRTKNYAVAKIVYKAALNPFYNKIRT
jgi:hypothetical protein